MLRREAAFLDDILGDENDENCLPGTVADMLEETERSMKPKRPVFRKNYIPQDFFYFLKKKTYIVI